MELDFHVSPEGAVYAFHLATPDDPVFVYRSAVSHQGARLPGNCNVRPDRGRFITDEATNWPKWGYEYIGRLKFNRLSNQAQAEMQRRMDALLPAMDALWHGTPIPAASQKDFPRNRSTIELAAGFLRPRIVTTVLINPKVPSRYDWD